jgi:hypothetical protein
MREKSYFSREKKLEVNFSEFKKLEKKHLMLKIPPGSRDTINKIPNEGKLRRIKKHI